MTFDLTGIETQILTGVGIAIGGMLIAFGQRLLAWMNVKLSVAQKAELEDNAGKALAFGISQAQHEIAAKGWDHIDVKDHVLAAATAYAIDKFPDSLARVGVDTSKPIEATQKLADVMERKFPEAVTVAAASPATPEVPEPVVPVVDVKALVR